MRQCGRARCVFPTAWFASAKAEPPRSLARSRAAFALAPTHLSRAFLPAVADALLSLLAPENCRLCDAPLVHAGTHPVCQTCLLSILPLEAATCCCLCGEPLEPDSFVAAGDATKRQCSQCDAAPPRFVRATSYALYQDVRQPVHLLKFEGLVQLAEPLGQMLAHAILQHRAGAPRELAVVPVPLFRGKRGFNQSTLLAREALRIVRRDAPGWRLRLEPSSLRRIRRTESQFLLSRTERQTNLRGAFAADGRVRGLDVLLIDDVYTTGTTARECTRTLLAAGAASVRVATLARAGRDTASLWQPRASEQSRTG